MKDFANLLRRVSTISNANGGKWRANGKQLMNHCPRQSSSS